MVNEALEDPLFWQLYYLCEFEQFPEEAVVRQLKALARDFAVRTDADGETPVLRFRLPLGDRFEIGIDFTLEEFMCRIGLDLHDAEAGKSVALGWWDDIRWHPFCLREEELDRLVHYWSRHAPAWYDARIGLLLLAPFVGLTEAGARDRLADRVNAAYRDLCLGAAAHPPLAIKMRADYRWSHDGELGWLFSGDYACYSIRNRAHLGGGEGDFPFTQFNAVMDAIAATP